MPRACGALGNTWGPWQASTSKPCRSCPACGTLHAGVADIEIYGECPKHGSSKIPIYGMSLGSAVTAGHNFIDHEMQCGDFPVGVTHIWVNLKEPSILSFTMKVHCYNCRKKADVVLLMNKAGVQCKTIKAIECCDRPVLEYIELSARLLKYGDRTFVPLQDITFAPPQAKTQSQPGLLQVFPMANKWVALEGPQQDYYATVQANFSSRGHRVNNLHGPQYDNVQVEVVNEDFMSLGCLNKSDITMCPRCGEVIERDGGCNRMTCPRCQHSFDFSKTSINGQCLATQ